MRRLFGFGQAGEIIDKLADLFRGKDEFRHFRMSGDDTFRQTFGKVFSRIALGDFVEWRRFGKRAFAGSADSVTFRAIFFSQFLTRLSWQGNKAKYAEADKKASGDHGFSPLLTLPGINLPYA